ncbi:MAG: hypothetical protein KF868_19045, partial [Acidobacteria bacterium]|nr:hypothetical protein [Acidobacteriota bacterium]
MSTQVSAQGEGSQQQYLLTSLVEIGSEYDCYFTIEEAWAGSEPQNRLESYMVHRAFKQEGLQEELRFLQQLVPNLAFQVNSKNPKIIHV